MNDTKLGRPKTSPEKKMLHEAVGKRIKQEREKLRLSQQKMLEVLRDDYNYDLAHYNAISNYEKGNREQPDKLLARLADIFQVRLEYLQCKDDFRTYTELYEWADTTMKSMAPWIAKCLTLEELTSKMGYSKGLLQLMQMDNRNIYQYLLSVIDQAIKNYDMDKDDFIKQALDNALANFLILQEGRDESNVLNPEVMKSVIKQRIDANRKGDRQ